jgi:hypothetical protein
MKKLTYQDEDYIREHGGTDAWKVNPDRALACQYVVLCRNAKDRLRRSQGPEPRDCKAYSEKRSRNRPSRLQRDNTDIFHRYLRDPSSDSGAVPPWGTATGASRAGRLEAQNRDRAAARRRRRAAQPRSRRAASATGGGEMVRAGAAMPRRARLRSVGARPD